MIFASTGGFSHVSASRTAQSFLENDITNIELSGGTFCPNQISELKKLTTLASFQPHNYFPPPRHPFVLNLASLDEHIYDASLKHIINSIRICTELGAKYYSFHAGFRVDPKPKELGKKFKVKKILSKKEAEEIFLNRLIKLNKIAKKNNVKLLIENNVVNKKISKLLKQILSC